MTPSLLCETVTGATMAELVARRDAAAEADMVEVRLDGVADPDVERALEGRRTPVIVTCRPRWEGGCFDGSEAERRRLLADALARGAEYVDVEWRAGFDDLIRAHAPRVVVSLHDFAGVPGDLDARVRVMRATGAAFIKVAISATRLTDTLPLLDIASGGDAVVIGMGDAGVPTRLLAERFGSRWTYGGQGVAPGQLPAARMISRFRFRSIRKDTAIYGVVGRSVLQSLSPVMHNAAFAASSLDAVSVPLEAADVDDFRTFAARLGIAGAAVMHPFERDALRASETADERTRRAGAADTLRRVRKDPAHAPGRAGPFGPADAWQATTTGVEASSGPPDATRDDLSMIVARAERQFEWWTGQPAPKGVMRAAALAEAGQRELETQRAR